MLKFPFILFISSLFFISCTKDTLAPVIVGEYEGTFTSLTESTRTYLSQTTNQVVTNTTTSSNTYTGLLKFEVGEEDQIILTQIGASILSSPITLTKEDQTSPYTYSFDEYWRDGLAVFYPKENKLHFSMTKNPGSYGSVVTNSSKTETTFEGYLKK